MLRKFLLVDDEINTLRALKRTLRLHLHQDEPHIELFTEPRKALERCAETTFDIVISDYLMPEMDGVRFFKAVKGLQPAAVRLMLSASADLQAVINAVNQAEVFRYITKPWRTHEIEDTVRVALAYRDRMLEDRRLADLARLQRGEMSPQELEAKHLEAQEPGITRVNWGPDGSVLLDQDDHG